MSDPNDDVVFKLRNWKLRTDLRVAIDQAADEIERLRTAHSCSQMDARVARADRDRLRAALDRADVIAEAGEKYARIHCPNLEGDFSAIRNALAGASETGSVPPMDEGPWHVLGDKVSGDLIGVSSDDFKRDVLLRVDGDFGCAMEKADYCAWLARTLNLNTGHSHCPHCGQWHRLELGC